MTVAQFVLMLICLLTSATAKANNLAISASFLEPRLWLQEHQITYGGNLQMGICTRPWCLSAYAQLHRFPGADQHHVNAVMDGGYVNTPGLAYLNPGLRIDYTNFAGHGPYYVLSLGAGPLFSLRTGQVGLAGDASAAAGWWLTPQVAASVGTKTGVIQFGHDWQPYIGLPIVEVHIIGSRHHH